MRKRIIKTQKSINDAEHTWAQVELVLASVLLVLGGFALRISDHYEFVMIGVVLGILGGWRLWRTRPGRQSLPLEAERLYHRLDSSLSAEYTYYPSHEESTRGEECPRDWLVGPWGIGVVSRFDCRGVLNQRDEAQWNYTPEEGEDSFAIENPLLINKEELSRFRAFLREHECDPARVPLHSYLVLMKNRLEGDVLDNDSVIRMQEFSEIVVSLEPKKLSENQLSDWERWLYKFLKTERNESVGPRITGGNP